MKFRKSLYSALLLAILLEMGGSLRISADTETTSSQEAVSSESSSTTEDPTTTSAEAAPSTTSETSPDSTEALTSIEALSEEEADTTEEFEAGIALTESASSIAIGDNYPAYLKNIPYYSYTVDPWSYYHRQCTSFVAFRLINVNKFNDVRMFGNATDWGTNARNRGYLVDKTPAYGSVAWFSAGHVAWVSDIRGSYVEIEEYNVPANSGNYKKRIVPISSVTGFIHFKDIQPNKTVATESVSLDKTAQTLTVGSSFVLTAALKPTNASNNTVQWTTSNPKVATVTNGNVVAVSPGSAVITARTVSGGKTAKANITVQAGKQVAVYRLYNPSIKRHLYSQDTNEARILQGRGWNFEGQSFVTSSGGQPVYRLYNPSLKEHLYTTNKTENDILATQGWSAEGVAWYSYGTKPVYRLYHPGLTIHLYSADKNEVDTLMKRGWKNEDISFYTN